MDLLLASESVLDFSLYSTVSTYYPNLGMLIDDAENCLFHATHAPYIILRQSDIRFPQLAAAFKKARESTPMNKRHLKAMSKNQRAMLKRALHFDVKLHFEKAEFQAFDAIKSFATEPLPSDALQCLTAIGDLIDDAKGGIRKLEERIKNLERAEIEFERIASNAKIIDAYKASIAEDVEFNSIDTGL
jgi:hypothetical protein